MERPRHPERLLARRRQTLARNRRRTKRASTVRRIQAAARERQRAYRKGGHPNLTTRLTTELNGPEHVLRPEGLFAEARQEMAEL